jgi:hypothetical protein
MKRQSLQRLFLAVIALLALSVSALANGGATVVRPDKMRGWEFSGDGGTPGSGELASGEAPMGLGSLRLQAAVSAERYAFHTTAHAGTRLADIDALSYYSYRRTPVGLRAVSIALQFDVDLNDDGIWDGRLVFEPYLRGASAQNIPSGVWQQWNAGGGKWWWSRNASPWTDYFCSGPGKSCLKTLNEITAIFPNARIIDKMMLKAGSGWTDFDGNADALRISVNGIVTLYDFEPGKEACNKGGWKGSTDPVFNNQGDCVSYMVGNER